MVTTREEAEEMAAAYRKGVKDAEGKLRQHIVAQKEQWTQARLFVRPFVHFGLCAVPPAGGKKGFFRPPAH